MIFDLVRIIGYFRASGKTAAGVVASRPLGERRAIGKSDEGVAPGAPCLVKEGASGQSRNSEESLDMPEPAWTGRGLAGSEENSIA